MAGLSRAGLYYASVKSFGWDAEKYKAKKLQLNIHFQVLSMWNGTNWDESLGGLNVTGWFYPVRKDGAKNDGFIEQMTAAFAWDGVKLSALKPAGMKCQIDVQEEVYEGKKQLKVNWIHHADWTGDSARGGELAADQCAALDDVFAVALGAPASAPKPK